MVENLNFKKNFCWQINKFRIKIELIDYGSYRGIFATEDIEKDELILSGNNECMICARDVQQKTPVVHYLREYLVPIIGDSDKVDLILHLLINNDGIYESNLPNATFFETNFPQLWDDELVRVLSPHLANKINRMKQKEPELRTSV